MKKIGNTTKQAYKILRNGFPSILSRLLYSVIIKHLLDIFFKKWGLINKMYTIPSLIKYIVRVLTSDSLRYARAYDTEFFSR